MGYVVRHSTSNVNKTRRRGKVAIGNDSSGYDKTSSSGLYNGVPPVEGKHNFVKVAQGGDPNFYNLTDQELLNFVNGLGERNLTHKTPSQAGWAGSYSLTDNDTRTFRLTTQQNNAATTSAWRTWYWDVSDYEGQTVAISADVEFVSETNCTFLSMTIGQGNTGQYTTHIAGSDAADRVTINTKPTNSIRMEWSGSINATGIVGFTQWINNVTTNGANAIIEVSNVQIEVNDHVTDFSNPDKTVATVFQALQYISDRDDIIFTDDIKNDNTVTDSLVLHLDPRSKSSFLDNKPVDNLARVDSWRSIWNNSGTAEWNDDDNSVPRLFPNIPVQSMMKTTNGNSHLGIGYVASGISEDVQCTYSMYIWIPSSNSDSMSGAAPYMRPFPANYNEVTLAYNGSTLWGSWPRDKWIRIEGTGIPNSTSNGGVSTAYISSYLNTAGDKVYYTAPQFENKSSASPFISGSRSQSPTWKDLSGNENNGTLANDPTFNPKGWFELDGTNDEITVSDNSTLDLTSDMSFEILVKANSSQNNLYPRLVDKSVYLVHLSQTSPFSIAQNINTSGGLRQTSIASAFSSGEWTHIVTNYNGRYGKIYVNGKLVKTRDFSSTLNCNTNSTTFTIGGNTGTTRQLNGDVAQVKVYNKALSQSEVSQNYYGGDIVTDGLAFSYDAGNLVSYEEGSTTIYSMTGSINGTLTNGTTYTGSNGGNFIFDGTNDQIDFGDVDVLGGASSATWEMWVRPHEYTGSPSTWRSGITTWNDPSSGLGHTWILDLRYRSYYLGFRTTDVGNYPSFAMQGGSSPTHFPDNEWAHYVGTYDGSQAKVYINGELIATASKTGNIASKNANEKLKIGVDRSTTAPMNGEIPIARLYKNKALSHSEVLQNYNAQKARFT